MQEEAVRVRQVPYASRHPGRRRVSRLAGSQEAKGEMQKVFQLATPASSVLTVSRGENY